MSRREPGRLPSRRQIAALGGWLVAAGVYVGIGLYEVDFLLSYWVALAYVVLAGWLVPAAARRLSRRLRAGDRSSKAKGMA